MRKPGKELRSQSILYYIFAYSTVIILIILVMGIYLYQFYYKTIYADFLTSNREHVDSELNRHENDLQIVNDILYQMGLSDSTRFKLKEAPEKAIRLEKLLHQYTAVSQFFQLLLYKYHGDDYFYSGTTSISDEYFFRSGCVPKITNADDFKAEVESESRALRVLPEQFVSGLWSTKYILDSKVTIYIQAIAPQFQETMLFFVPDFYYDKLLESEEGSERSDYLIYGGQVIVSRGMLSLEENQVLALAQEGLEQRRVRLGKENYLLTAKRGESGVVYCSLQSMDIFHGKIVSGQWGIILLLFLCVCPTAVLVLVLSKRLTSKVRNLNFLLDAREDSYNIDSIESGIQMLVASNEKMDKENLQLKKTRFIRSFIRGDFLNTEEVLHSAAEVSMELSGKTYLVILLGMRSGTNESKAHTRMLETVEQTAHLDGYGILLASNNQSLFTLFADTRERIEETLGRIFAVGKESCEDFVMAVSDYHQDLIYGSAAYLEADTAFSGRFLQDNNKIIRFREVASISELNVLPDAYLQKLQSVLKHRDKEGITQAVEDICRKMTKESPSLFAFRLLYNRIIHVLVTEWNGGKGEAESLYNALALSQCLTIADFNDLLCEACRVIIENNPTDEPDESDVVHKAVSYMKENYSNPNLTMAALADYLQISSVTLAVVFKNSMGMRPSDYLANLRMEQARELLVTTDMRIYEISMAVGYEDDHVFTRRFKKYTGKTPGQYREERF